MQELSETILRDWQVRKTRAQKAAFRAFLRPELEAIGYAVAEEEGGWPRSTNLVVGDVASARVVFTAHYDTCARLPLPNFLAPKNLLVTILYQLLWVVIFFLFALGVGMLCGYLTGSFLATLAGVWGGVILILVWMFFGPANPHTANDNTSGVTVLTEALATLPEALRGQVAFVFFDNEEMGMIGASAFRKAHAKDMAQKPLINFDCVSDGDHLMLVLSKAMRADAAMRARLDAALIAPEGKTRELVSSGRAFYPSDQMAFPKNAAAAAFRRMRGIGWYVERIHTARDTVFDRENIEAWRAFIVRLASEEAGT